MIHTSTVTLVLFTAIKSKSEERERAFRAPIIRHNQQFVMQHKLARIICAPFQNSFHSIYRKVVLDTMTVIGKLLYGFLLRTCVW